MGNLKLGYLGASKIADMRMTATVDAVDGIESYAVAARDLVKAKSFAENHGCKKAYGSYEELANDPDVDVIYVSTLQSQHFQHTMLCLENGKHVLCEKAFMLNKSEAEEAVNLARAKGLFLGEAIWTRFLPFVQEVKKLLDGGIIGNPTALVSNNGFDMRGIPRIDELELGGGAVLDVGIYAMTAASLLFGDDVVSFSTEGVLTEKGVDAHSSTVWRYRDGRLATINTSMDCCYGDKIHVYGDKGMMVIDETCNWSKATVYNTSGQVVSTHQRGEQITGFEYEVEAMVKAINSGLVEYKEVPHALMLLMMERMDEMRKAWGMTFPKER